MICSLGLVGCGNSDTASADDSKVQQEANNIAIEALNDAEKIASSDNSDTETPVEDQSSEEQSAEPEQVSTEDIKAEESTPTSNEAPTEVSSKQATKPSTVTKNPVQVSSNTAKASAPTQSATNPTPSTPENNTPTTQECSHDWQPVYTSKHHEEVYHIEKKEWTETHQVTEKKWVCNGCHKTFYTAADIGNHLDAGRKACLEAGGNTEDPQRCVYSTVYPWTHDKTEHITAPVKVVDKEAYDEQVLTGYKCSKCGATK